MKYLFPVAIVTILVLGLGQFDKEEVKITKSTYKIKKDNFNQAFTWQLN